MPEERPRWSSRTKLTVSLLLLAFGLLLLYNFREVITPLILAVVIAYALSPLAGWFERRFHIKRGYATLLTYLVAIVIILAIPLIIIPPLSAQSAELNLDFQRIFDQGESLLASRYAIAGYVIDVEEIFGQVSGSVINIFEPFFGQTLGYAIELITSLVWVVFVIVVAFYLVMDGKKVIIWLESITPIEYRSDFGYLLKEINLIWNAFFRGQLVLASVVAIIFTISGFFIGIPFALAMGVLAGLLEFLPSIGHGIWLVIATILALSVGSTWLPIPNWMFALLIIGLHILFQQFDLNYLLPRIIGRRVQLHPLVVILGIVAGALVAGVLGVLLAAPTIATVRVLIRYIYANLFDKDPFPETASPELPPPNVRWWEKGAVEAGTIPERDQQNK
jgi:predicted PurR-regulated permease PerM